MTGCPSTCRRSPSLSEYHAAIAIGRASWSTEALASPQEASLEGIPQCWLYPAHPVGESTLYQHASLYCIELCMCIALQRRMSCGRAAPRSRAQRRECSRTTSMTWWRSLPGVCPRSEYRRLRPQCRVFLCTTYTFCAFSPSKILHKACSGWAATGFCLGDWDKPYYCRVHGSYGSYVIHFVRNAVLGAHCSSVLTGSLEVTIGVHVRIDKIHL